jgi:hypothetical protein
MRLDYSYTAEKGFTVAELREFVNALDGLPGDYIIRGEKELKFDFNAAGGRIVRLTAVPPPKPV